MTLSIQDLINQLSPVDTDEMKRVTKAKKLSAIHRGKSVSAEARAQQSAALKGRPLSEEHRAAIAAGGRGLVRSAETRAAIAAGNRGKPLSEERRAAISAATKGRVTSAETRAQQSAALKGRPKRQETRDSMREAIAAKRRALFEKDWDILEVAITDLVMRRTRINWPATSEKHGLPAKAIREFLHFRRAGLL